MEVTVILNILNIIIKTYGEYSLVAVEHDVCCWLFNLIEHLVLLRFGCLLWDVCGSTVSVYMYFDL